MQFLVILMARRRIEIITGKLRTAIKMLLLLAFEAILDSKVSEAENPKETRIISSANRKTSSIGLEKNTVKSRNPKNESAEQTKNPYPILEIIIAEGLAIE